MTTSPFVIVTSLAALASAEMSLADAGAKVEPGVGVAAAQEYYRAAVLEAEQAGATR